MPIKMDTGTAMTGKFDTPRFMTCIYRKPINIAEIAIGWILARVSYIFDCQN
jgi:hypothetical protein